VIRDLLTSILVIGLIHALVPAAPQTPGNQSPGNQPPGNATAANGTALKPLAPDPAAIVFATEIGLVLVSVKPASVADYESVIVALQEVLAQATDEETRTLARSWRVFKATELDVKANPLYVHMLMPTSAGVDYRPSLWLDKLLAGAPAELLAKYRDAFAAPPSKLALSEFANMAVAPIPKPTNASPGAPAVNGSPAKPGNQPPPAPLGFQLSGFGYQR
jgi:hypothetical protein